MASIIDSFKEYYAKDRQTWRKWLEKNHAKCPGIWLKYYKKGTGKPRVDYADAVEEALCFGWIDSTSRPGDDEYYLQLFMPRKEKSGWSQLNKTRVKKLIDAGLMTPAGMEKIEAAKANGTWEKLDQIEAMTIPKELEKKLAASKTAKKYFEGLAPSNKKMLLYWLSSAKRNETKAKRLEEIMEALKEQRMPDRYTRQKPS
jgi:uncharacterized protein YdeI (YjbR/CyaY-like superfamily)